ncbi:hypothetical protein OPV22_022177 [Ensete ventricosum]|uniref:Uncharacterized protein n=1 Tax=Ensete ventricosum TaxID=4639 RepID=A0AAV8QRZ8_ENSVE|nr:hypothetical protein OPV22_022177 [Ensete ventricosum]
MSAKRPPPSTFDEYASEGTTPSFQCFGYIDNIHRRVNRFLGSMEMALRLGNSDERVGRNRRFQYMMRERGRRGEWRWLSGWGTPTRGWEGTGGFNTL